MDDVSSLLRTHGFRIKWLEIFEQGWGNAFYVHDRVFTNIDLTLPYAGQNIALNKPAKQSSESVWSTANDAQGGANGVMSGQFGFHTDSEAQPWWQVDLQCTFPIKEIRIYNRSDGAQERARSLKVLLSNDEEAWREIHDQKGTVVGTRKMTKVLRVFAEGESARFIRIRLNEKNYLHLKEIEVY